MLNPEYTSPSMANLSSSNENLKINSAYLDKDNSMAKGLRNIVIGGATFSVIITFVLILQITLGPRQTPLRIGIVTQDAQCTQIGANMVRNGGNSVDAFIASALCLAVVNPFAAGLGAGGFLVVRDHKRDKNLAVNCYFKSGSNTNQTLADLYLTRPASGVLNDRQSIAIPGELKCLTYVYYKYSRFNWRTLAGPAIDLAKNGFKVSKLLADNLQQLDQQMLNQNPYMKQVFTVDGNLVQENDVIKNPILARTLGLIIEDDNGLYDGQNLTYGVLKSTAGQILMSDLNNYKEIENQLVTATYQGFNLLTTAYPSSGPVLQFILNLTSQLNIGIDSFQTTQYYSQLVQAIQLGYLLQGNIADPVSDNTYASLQNRTSAALKLYLNSMLANASINIQDYYISSYNQNDDLYTNFISVNDHNDLMVSYVGTLGSLWGSQIMSTDGYFLNNGYNLFSFENDADNPNPQNFVNINKQPRGLMAPIITYNTQNPCLRRFVISYTHTGVDDFGLSALTQVILKLLTDLSFYPSAVSDKRIEYEASNLCFENGFDETLQSNLINYLRQINLVPVNSTTCIFDAVNLIMKKDPEINGVVDITRNISANNLIFFNS